jgi:hypothetical protein
MTARAWASLAGVGLFTAVAAWALHQQAGYLLASWACEKAAIGIWISGLLAVLLLLAGAILSSLSFKRTQRGSLPQTAPRPRWFMAIIALMASALFLFALILQMAAPFFLPGCVG